MFRYEGFRFYGLGLKRVTGVSNWKAALSPGKITLKLRAGYNLSWVAFKEGSLTATP